MDQDDDMYDEFGNPLNSDSGDENDPIHQDLSDISAEENSGSDEEHQSDDENDNNQLVHHQDSAKGVTLAQRFGPDVATVLARDMAPANAPVIQPAKERNGKVEITLDESSNSVDYSLDYMINTAYKIPERIRNIALVGNLHTGKTSLVDMLVLQTHKIELSQHLKNFKPLRYTDNHKLEISRGMTIKTTPVTLLLPDVNEKSYVFNILDTPGHVNFMDETISALEACDGMVLVVDAVEGITFKDKLAIDEALKRNLPMSLVLNKLDRLILELRLPVTDACYKIQYIIDQANKYLQESPLFDSYSYGNFSPLKNITFASLSLQFCFSLRSFAQLYLDTNGAGIDPDAFSQRLWGANYYDPHTNKFTKDSKKGSLSRTFIHFILEPIYKIITYTLTRSNKKGLLELLLSLNFGIHLSAKQLSSDSQILLPEIMKTIFPISSGLVNLITSSISCPSASKPVPLITKEPIPHNYLVAQVVKLIESSDGSSFYSLVRVCQGVLKKGSQVKVVGDSFNNDKEVSIHTIEDIVVSGGRYKIPINEAGEGFIVLVKGLDSEFSNQAIILDDTIDPQTINKTEFFDYSKDSVFKVAVEPKNSTELPRLVECLKKVKKSYLSSVIKLEDSGEHVIFGTGEVALDCILHDVRNFFDDGLEINVSDAMAKFSETVTQVSATKISSLLDDISISIIAEPLNNAKLSQAIEAGRIDLSTPIKELSKVLRKQYDLDSLESRNVWDFGPGDLKQPNILVDDTLEYETNKKTLDSVKRAIKVGFQWSCNEGPLCDEPIRNTKFRLLDFKATSTVLESQIIPLTRRACYTGFLTAQPRLMEPIYKVYVTSTYKAQKFIEKIVEGRRGVILANDAIPGTHLFVLEGRVPVIESVGLETEIRLQTLGQAMCFFKFDRYKIAPGDPMDGDVYLPDLKPVPTESISRDFVLKTRKRKGIAGEPSIQKFIEPELFEKLQSIGMT